MRIQLIVLPLMLTACSSFTLPTLSSITPHRIDVQQGNLITPEFREQIKVGMSRALVRSTLGTPLLNDPFHTDRWDYVYRLEQKGKLAEQQHMVLYFKDDVVIRVDDSGMPPLAAASEPDDPASAK